MPSSKNREDITRLLALHRDELRGFFEVVRLQRLLGQILGRTVDLVPADSIKRQLRDRILGEAQRVA